MDIIRFGYSFFAVNSTFNLNEIRGFNPVKMSGDTYIPEEVKVEIILNQKVTFDNEEIEKVNVESLKKERDQYSRWWNEEQTAKRKIDEELKCLKLDVQRMKDESVGGSK